MRVCATLWIVLSAATAVAADPLAERIDALISAGPDFSSVSAAPAPEGELLRRVSLDLTGTIPLVATTRAWFADNDPEKYEKLVDRLLASPEHARHLQRVFDMILMRNLPAKAVKEGEWDTWLRESFAANKPWDQMAREILSADGLDPANRAPARFYLDREGEVNAITRDVGRVFLGTNLECAQCHNHPQVDEWKQDHYYGIAAYYVRSFLFSEKGKTSVFAEKAEGEVSYESVFDIRDKISKGPKSSPPRVFENVALAEPKFDKPDDAYEVKPTKDNKVRPVPKFSRRSNVATAIATPENRRFARSGANRLWSLVFGRGIVDPVDFDHSENPPSHPELLDELTDEFVARKFDIRSMLRAMVLSQAYQRASRRVAPDGTPLPESDPARFAQAPVKPLSPEQFCWALHEGTGDVELQRIALKDKATEEKLAEVFADEERRFKSVFGSQVAGKVQEKFEATTDQILFLSNDPMVLNLCQPRGENLAARLLKTPADNPQAIAEELFLSALVRLPEAEEVQFVTEWLAGKEGPDRATAVPYLVWAVVTSAENRVNH